MTITAQADILGAITAKLRTITEITNLTSTRISGELQDGWFTGPDARAAIWLRRTGGPIDINDWLVGIHRARLDCWCYGSSAKGANDLMSLVLSALAPEQSGGAGSFRQTVGSAIVRVYNIIPEVEPVSDRDPEEGWRYSWCPLMVSWDSVAS